MALLLGVDTGGTYTDAVLIRDEAEVIASAKSLTTRGDLAIGIGAAVRSVVADAGVDVAEIGMASLSTTLATNALVEGQGGRVGLVMIGFRERDIEAHGLGDALAGDPYIVLAGGHDHAGIEKAVLDLDALREWAEAQEVSAFAVAAQFATRNPAHEVAAMICLAEVTGRPVSASHHLSAKLGGPKRALTALLNARLIGLTHRLILRAEEVLREIGIAAPMMVVRGDGALMSAAQAVERPIETILSGPAASIVGARWLTGADEALVSDIGGTTTDIALLRGGRPEIDPDGARVGPYRTMVEAVAMRTHGLGGDSAVEIVSNGLRGGLTLGPRRVLPVSLIAHEAADVVLPALEAQLRAPVPGEYDAAFVRAVPGQDIGGLGPREVALLDRIGDVVHPVGRVLSSRMEAQALRRLVARGLVQVSGVTPTDAVHVLGRVDAWNAEAARMGLELLARRRVGTGDRVSDTAEGMAQLIIDQMTRDTGLALLETAFAEENPRFDLAPGDLARHPLMQAALGGHRGLMSMDAKVDVPVIGLGASAACYYPAVGAYLNCRTVLPEHGGVANAIGAVVGRITVRRQGTVTSPSEGLYRVHSDAGPQDFSGSEDAMAALEDALRREASSAAIDAGSEDISLSVSRDIRRAEAEAREVFVEAVITVEASGRPRIAL